MFGFTDHNVSVTNLNLRIEKLGDERVPACDIKIVVDLFAERLNEISPGLCESLFRKPGPGDQMPLVEVGKKPAPGFTALKHPGLEPSRIKQKFPGYELQLVSPTASDADDALFLADVEVKNYVIEPHEGGSATVTFTASSRVEEDEIAALLAFLRDEDAIATLTPPKLSAQADEQPKAA